MGKRKSESTKSKLLKKLKKLERRMKHLSSDSSDEAEEVEITPTRRSPNMGEDSENVPPQSLENILPLSIENDCLELKDVQTDADVENVEHELIEEEVPQEELLDDQVLEILGVDPQPEKVGEELHKQIAQRWNMILKKGLNKEEKDKIEDENPPFSNLKQMLPPLLNPEVGAAVNDASKKRDQLIQKRQKQISTALACLGSCLQMCIKDVQGRKIDIIKKLNDASILLCDSIHLDTRGRRSLLLSVINKDMKDFLLQSEAETHLFGEDLAEKIRTAKSVKRSGQELKVAEVKKFTPRQSTWVPRTNVPKNNSKTLNWRGPPRAEVKKRGGPSSRAPAADRTWEARRNHPRRK